jgi:hypothetical protein
MAGKVRAVKMWGIANDGRLVRCHRLKIVAADF